MMKLFQYWDNEELPADIGEWQASFREKSNDFEYLLFNRMSAANFILQQYGDRHVKAFLSVRVPAMQADYLRLCLIDTYGGIYCDIDHRLKESLMTLVAENIGDLMLSWGDLLNTAFLLFRKSGNAYIRACLDVCTDNIENRRFATAFTATGPGVQNAIRVLLDPDSLSAIEKSNDSAHLRDWGFYELLDVVRGVVGDPTPDLRGAFAAIDVRHTFYLARWMDSDPPEYKKTDRHWFRWPGAIYQD